MSSSTFSSSEDSHVCSSRFEHNDLYAEEAAMIRGRLPSYIQPTAITRVVNPHLRHLYQQTRDAYMRNLGEVTELSLWHATARDNVESITTSNFNYRLAERSLYGYGVCFSTDAGYSNFYCNKGCGDDRALILTNVLVGSTTPGYRSLENLPGNCDTAVDKPGGLVYVKFADHEFYPAYVVYYSNRYYKGENTLHLAVPVDMEHNRAVVPQCCYRDNRQDHVEGNYNWQENYYYY